MQNADMVTTTHSFMYAPMSKNLLNIQYCQQQNTSNVESTMFTFEKHRYTSGIQIQTSGVQRIHNPTLLYGNTETDSHNSS